MIRIVACGRVKEKWMQEGIQEYLKRIRPYEKIEVCEVADEKAPESNSEAENTIVKNKEGEKILKQLREDEYVILDLSEALIRRADMRWKLSDNTFPHQLCRIIVLEQIYRSFRILHHEPYHK